MEKEERGGGRKKGPASSPRGKNNDLPSSTTTRRRVHVIRPGSHEHHGDTIFPLRFPPTLVRVKYLRGVRWRILLTVGSSQQRSIVAVTVGGETPARHSDTRIFKNRRFVSFSRAHLLHRQHEGVQHAGIHFAARRPYASIRSRGKPVFRRGHVKRCALNRGDIKSGKTSYSRRCIPRRQRSFNGAIKPVIITIERAV